MKKNVLQLNNVSTYYNKICALRSCNLKVKEGEVVALVGLNGAGKTTLLKTILGLTQHQSGSIKFYGEDISAIPTYQRVRLGIAYVAEGRNIFRTLTVRDNLYLASNNYAHVLKDFPHLHKKLNQVAGTLSGGEQQMLTLARAIIMNPKLLLLDEPSMGLAPKVIKQVYRIIKELLLLSNRFNLSSIIL